MNKDVPLLNINDFPERWKRLDYSLPLIYTFEGNGHSWSILAKLKLSLIRERLQRVRHIALYSEFC